MANLKAISSGIKGLLTGIRSIYRNLKAARIHRYRAYGTANRWTAKRVKWLRSMGMGTKTSTYVAKAIRLGMIGAAVAVPINLVRKGFRLVKDLAGSLLNGGPSTKATVPPGAIVNPVGDTSPALGESLLKSQGNQSKSQLELELAKAEAAKDLWNKIANQVPKPDQQVRDAKIRPITPRQNTTDGRLDAVIEILNKQIQVQNDTRKNTLALFDIKVAEIKGRAEEATKLYQSIIRLQIQSQSATNEAIESVKKSTQESTKQSIRIQQAQLVQAQQAQATSRKLSIGRIALGLGALSVLQNMAARMEHGQGVVRAGFGGVMDTLNNMFKIFTGGDDDNVEVKDKNDPNLDDKVKDPDKTSVEDNKLQSPTSNTLSNIFGAGLLGLGASKATASVAKKVHKKNVTKYNGNEYTKQLNEELQKVSDDYDEKIKAAEKKGDRAKADKLRSQKSNKIKSLNEKYLSKWESSVKKVDKAGKIFKSAGKIGKFLGKKLPFVGAVLGAVDAYNRFKNDDPVGGVISVLEGVTSIVPGLGTAVSGILGGINIARDLSGTSDKDSGTYGREFTTAGGTMTSSPETQKFSDSRFVPTTLNYATGTQGKGTVTQREKVHPGGPAIVGDGGRAEVIISPDNKTATITPSTPTAVNLPRGTKVIPMVKSMKSDTKKVKGKRVPMYSEGTSGSEQTAEVNPVTQLSQLNSKDRFDLKARYLWYLLSNKNSPVYNDVIATFGRSLNNNEIASILGVWDCESTLSPWAGNRKEKLNMPEHYGEGLAQWSNKDRKTRALGFIGKKFEPGLISSLSYTDQIRMALAELRETHPAFTELVKSNKNQSVSLNELVDYFLRGFENGGPGLATKSYIDNTYRKHGYDYSKLYADRLASANKLLSMHNTWESSLSEHRGILPRSRFGDLANVERILGLMRLEKLMDSSGARGKVVNGISGEGNSSDSDFFKNLKVLGAAFTGKTPTYSIGTEASNNSIPQLTSIENNNTKSEIPTSKPVLNNIKGGNTYNSSSTTVNIYNTPDQSKLNELSQL